MSQRILCVGLDSSGKSSLVNRLKFGDAGQQVPTQSINVNSLEFNGMKYTIWEVGGGENNRESFREYTQNTHGILYVVDGTDAERVSQSRDYLESILADPSLKDLPLLLYINKGNSVIKKAVTDLGLSSVSDREIFIQNSDASSGVGVNAGFDWLSKQLLTRKKLQTGYSFDAEPKVVKGRQKYKQEEENESKSQQTFSLLMQEKKVKMMNPVQQEQEYVRLEKERIKIENMNAQLINFKKNKKKMAPYDIKPSPNPRIDVNLEFFLTDNVNSIPPTQTEVDCQTDEFQPKPPSPKYVPKKTGIDAYTQVEDYELFDFDREVTPIVDVIVTKTLEQSMLEIEQDEEILNMRKFKRQYEGRVDGEKRKRFAIFEREVNTMKEKDKLLDSYRLKEIQKIECLRRVQNYAIAQNYLRNVKVNAISGLFKSGYYPNEKKIAIETEFIDWLVDETSKELDERQAIRDSAQLLFDRQSLHQLKDAKKPHLVVQERRRKRAAQRRINESQDTRVVRLCYKDAPKYPTHFAKHLNRFLEGQLDEWKEAYNAKNTALQEQVDTSEITEEQRQRTLEEEFPEITGEYFGYGVNSIKRLAFTLAHSQYYQTSQKERKLELVALALNKNGQFHSRVDGQNDRPTTASTQENKTIRYKKSIRDITKKITDDEAILVDLEKLPADVWSVLFFLKLPNLAALESLKETDALRFSRVGVEDFTNAIPIDNVNVFEKVQLDAIMSTQTNEEEGASTIQNSYYFCYSVIRRPQVGWYLENIKYASKGMFEAKDEEEFFAKVARFWLTTEGEVSKKEDPLLSEADEIPMSAAAMKAPRKGSESVDHENARIIENQNWASQINVSGGGSIFIQKTYDEKTLKFGVNAETGGVTIDDQDFDGFVERLSEAVSKTDEDLAASAHWGFEFYFRGKRLTRLQTLKKCKSAFELEVRKKPEPIVEKVDDPEEGEGDGEEGDGAEDENQEE